MCAMQTLLYFAGLFFSNDLIVIVPISQKSLNVLTLSLWFYKQGLQILCCQIMYVLQN